MTEKIRECPFCGFELPTVASTRFGTHFVECANCGAGGRDFKTKKEAAESWNTRPAEDSLRAQRDRLVTMAAELPFCIFGGEKDCYAGTGGCQACIIAYANNREGEKK